MVQPHKPITTAESEDDHWRYAVTCEGTGCDGAAIYKGTKPTEGEAEAAAVSASEIHSRLCTDRLVIRPPIDRDHGGLMVLFREEDFMKGLGTLVGNDAERRFRQMKERCAELPYAEQPLIKRDTGEIIGYGGAAPWDDFIFGSSLEFNCRLIRCERRKEYGSEAGQALLDLWSDIRGGSIFARIDRENKASKALAFGLGFGPESIRTEERPPVGTEESPPDGKIKREIYQRKEPNK